MIEIQVPDLGENVEEAEVLKVLVKEGDSVVVDQAILEFETEKATFEMPSSEAGRVAKVHVKEGDTVKIGQVVLQLDEAALASGQKKSTTAAQDKPAGKSSGKSTAKKQSAMSTRKSSATAQAAPRQAAETVGSNGSDAEPVQRQPQEAQRTAVPGRQEAPTRPSAAQPHEAAAPADEDEDETTSAERAGARNWAAGPSTRRLARELGVDLDTLAAATAGGRVTRADLKEYVRRSAAGSGSPPSLPDFSRWGMVERAAFTRLERTAAERLTRAWHEIPHVTQHDEADITALEEARRRYDASRGNADPRVTWTVLAVKAVVAALREMPRFNSSYDAASQEIILKRYHHIGIAVDTERGLVVPVIRDADRKTTRQIAEEIATLAQRARDKKLLVEDMEGGTFTISNLGGIGGTSFTPIVNHPEVAILGMSRAALRPGLEGGAPQRMLPLSLSYDHRVIDGANAARFLRRIVKLLEDPLHLLLES